MLSQMPRLRMGRGKMATGVLNNAEGWNDVGCRDVRETVPRTTAQAVATPLGPFLPSIRMPFLLVAK